MNLSFDNVAQLCANVDLNNEKPTIDLSIITFFSPFALVYLGMFLRYYCSHGKQFKVVVPNNQPARDYLTQQNFWERFSFDQSWVQKEKMRCFSNSTSLRDIIDIENTQSIAEDIEIKITKVLRRNGVRINTSLVTETLGELVDNFSLHSKSLLGVIAMQYYPNLNRVVFAVGDCGIGIKTSLAKNPKYSYLLDKPHYESAVKAFEPLVSSMEEGGTGLTAVRDNVILLHGNLKLSTGDGFFKIEENDSTYGNMNFNLSGVQMVLSFPEEQL